MKDNFNFGRLPDGPIGQEADLVFYPPNPSRSSRRIAKRSRASGRGALTDPAFHPGKQQITQFESLLEMKVYCILRVKPVTRDILEQPPAIRYTDPSGRTRSHTFDFLWIHRDGTRVAVAVKPVAKAAKQDFQAELKAIRAALRKDYANRLILITDADFTRDEALNAQRLLMFRPHIRPEHITRVATVLPSLSYPLHLRDIIEALDIGPDGFGALLPALYDGRLVADLAAEITPDTLVQRGELS
ncbi:TnsA endonuclease N-terminal domain-containing protein [Palleronia caenipelagi]|uniref:TnsA endonuclease N-terminal domain-containing protein n=1 Tax=Palleronia caenipelagi TaxID=2489174 RepID=A0A547PMZ9_9RHOB|nr:TnsA endonuclease N-terminal domain-containing protein [Palleronia caenipelagi]TRD15527.1 hypothetical protein FEV53_16000 [Palleronia caenipelagi]